VGTDNVNGYLLDRGFQALLTAYPAAQRELDYDALDLRSFEAGARVWRGSKLSNATDPIKRANLIMDTAFSSVGTFADKWRVLRWRKEALARNPGDWLFDTETSASAVLEERGFSPTMIQGYWEPFFRSVFLERELMTSSRMLNYTFSMFARGSAAVPAKGMQAIPDQIAADLPDGTIQFNQKVTRITGQTVHLADGRTQAASSIVVATGTDIARDLLEQSKDDLRWKQSTTLYYDTPIAPDVGGCLVLNGTTRGPINHVCVPTRLSDKMAPTGRHLVSATVLSTESEMSDPVLFDKATKQLTEWFGCEVMAWRPIKAMRVRRAISVASSVCAPKDAKIRPGLWVCGDHVTLPSIQGTMESAQIVAEALIETEQRRRHQSVVIHSRPPLAQVG
jgi:phytoene dehydrogenase-like protein